MSVYYNINQVRVRSINVEDSVCAVYEGYGRIGQGKARQGRGYGSARERVGWDSYGYHVCYNKYQAENVKYCTNNNVL